MVILSKPLFISAGRGEKTGSVVIQTYEPDHYSIKAAAAQDYQAFYEEEILYRSLMDYPPVGGMLALHGQGEDESYLQMAMEYLKSCGYLQKSDLCKARAKRSAGSDQRADRTIY